MEFGKLVQLTMSQMIQVQEDSDESKTSLSDAAKGFHDKLKDVGRAWRTATGQETIKDKAGDLAKSVSSKTSEVSSDAGKQVGVGLNKAAQGVNWVAKKAYDHPHVASIAAAIGTGLAARKLLQSRKR